MTPAIPAAATAIPVELRNGKAAVKTPDTIFRRTDKGNIEVLTAWKTASHVQRMSRHAAEAPLPAVSA